MKRAGIYHRDRGSLGLQADGRTSSRAAFPKDEETTCKDLVLRGRPANIVGQAHPLGKRDASDRL